MVVDGGGEGERGRGEGVEDKGRKLVFGFGCRLGGGVYAVGQKFFFF